MVPPEDQDECDESLVYIQEKSNHQSDRSPRPLESRQISIKTINTTHQISNFSLSTHSNNENSVNRTTKLIVTEEEQTKRSRLENIKRDSSSSSKSSSLGKWFFDRKTQKKKYISLSGAILQGTEATVQAKLDNIGELRHIQQQTRHELEEFMKASLLSMKDFLRPSITSNDDCDASHTTASMIRYDKSKLDTWGIPIRTVQRYESRGLSHLFQWQIDCLCVDDGAALRGKNLVFSAPTSGGKTLVAEILMLRRLGMVKGTILFIVPYVALVEEKAEYFRTIWQDIGVSVRVCHGGDGGTGDLTSEVDVAVCTIERANIILNQLLDAGHETQLSMVVIDEVHMLSDNQRGYLLEVTLSKIKFLLRNSVQCVGMSATLPNLLDLAHWLDAALYTTSFRPVNLSVYLSCERSVYQCNQSSQPSIPGITTSFTDATNEPNIDLIPVRKVRIFDPSVVPVNSDPDAVVSLCLETVLQRKSVMLFCPSKDLCQKNARRIAESVYKLKAFVAAPLSAPTSASQTIAPIASQTVHHDSNFGSNYGSRSSSRIGAFTTQPSPFIYDSDEMDDETNDASTGSIPTAKYNVPTYGINNSSQLSRVAVGGNSDSNNNNNNSNSDNSSTTISASLAVDPPEIRSGRQRLLYQLQQCSIRLCSVLKETILQGVAYHHAGLTGEERRIIESGFRDGFINVLCATSTLAAGVNLPTHRAIIRSPKMGLKDLSVAEFRQMCGRAGRLNLDTNGEAILIIRKDEMRRGKHLVCADIEPLKSALHLGVGGGVQKLLLEMICCGRLVKMQDVEPFIRCTLMNAQNSSNEVGMITQQALGFLLEHKFVLRETDGRLSPQQLGLATALSGISPIDTLAVLPSLNDARRRFILKTGFHVVFLATPLNLSINPVWSDYEIILNALYTDYPGVEDVATAVGVSRAQILTFKANPPSRDSADPKTQLYRRFYNAMILFLLINERPLNKVNDLMKAERGQIQNLQRDASIFCAMLVAFCQKLNWPMLAAALDSMTSRLSLGVSEDIIPLARLGTELTASRCRALLKSGIKTPSDILRAGRVTVANVLYSCIPHERSDPAAPGKDPGSLARHKESLQKSCYQLADIILRRAQQHLIEEASLSKMLLP